MREGLSRVVGRWSSVVEVECDSTVMRQLGVAVRRWTGKSSQDLSRQTRTGAGAEAEFRDPLARLPHWAVRSNQL